MVGVPGFEPGASSSRTMRATRLRHTPTVCGYMVYQVCLIVNISVVRSMS